MAAEHALVAVLVTDVVLDGKHDNEQLTWSPSPAHQQLTSSSPSGHLLTMSSILVTSSSPAAHQQLTGSSPAAAVASQCFRPNHPLTLAAP
jgi:methionine-rich copper-binding protein CopC